MGPSAPHILHTFIVQYRLPPPPDTIPAQFWHFVLFAVYLGMEYYKTRQLRSAAIDMAEEHPNAPESLGRHYTSLSCNRTKNIHFRTAATKRRASGDHSWKRLPFRQTAAQKHRHHDPSCASGQNKNKSRYPLGSGPKSTQNPRYP